MYLFISIFTCCQFLFDYICTFALYFFNIYIYIYNEIYDEVDTFLDNHKCFLNFASLHHHSGL